jgi:hypothetical protein
MLRGVLQFTGLLTCASLAHAQPIIHDQPWDGVTPGRAATASLDNVPGSTYQLDNFSRQNFCIINRITFFGVEAPGGDPSANVACQFRIQRLPSFTNPSTIYAAGSTTAAYQNGNLVFEGLSANLAPGDYWITAWVERPSSGGTWLWRATTPVDGPEAVVHNPGGGQGFGTNPLPGFLVYGQSRDMAFRIQGDPLPEPSTLLTAIVGILLIAKRKG